MNEQPVGAPMPNPEAEFMRQMMQDAPEPPKKKHSRLFWVIIAAVLLLIGLGIGTMLLVRSGSSSASQPAADSVYSTEIAPSPSGCLMAADLKKNGISYIDQESLDGEANAFLSNIFFKPDTAEYLDSTAAEKEIVTTATLFKGTAGNTYNFEVIGAVRQDTQNSASKALATQRATKVKEALVAAGVDAGRIIIGTPTNSAAATDASGNSDRSVTIYIAQPGDCHE